MKGEDGFRRMILGYKMQEMSFLGRRLLKLGERENRRKMREKERGIRCLGGEENG